MKEKLIKIGVVVAVATVTIWSAFSIHLSKPKSEDLKVVDNQGVETVEGVKVDFIEDFVLEDLPSLKKENGVVTKNFGDKYIHFVAKETDSFGTLVSLAAKVGKKDEIIIIDRHFNASGGKASGFMMLSNDLGVEFATILNDE